MGIYRRPDSPFLWWSVTIDGHRFRGCCETASREEAKPVLKRERARLLAERPRAGQPELTLDQALARYSLEHAIRLPSAPNIAYMGENLIAGLGGATLLSRLAVSDIAAHVARRRADVSDASVNRELTILRAVLRMAALRWGVAVAAIDWKPQFLAEPAPRNRVLSAEQESRLFAALRADFHALVRFALMTGMRLSNVRELRWDQIDWNAGTVAVRVKGGANRIKPLSRAALAILSAERGRHPRHVFTYLVQRARSDKTRETERRTGERRPFTRDGWRKAWHAALTEAELADLRFHDLRHTFATRLYRRTRDLRLVQRALDHQSIETTLRYENSDIEDLRAALDEADESSASINPRHRS